VIKRVLNLIGAAFVYFCVATLLAQGVGVGVLWWRGTLSQDSVYRILAVLQGVDIDAIRDELEKKRQPQDDPQVSYEAIVKARLAKSLTLNVRQQAITAGLADLLALQSEVRTERQRLDDTLAGFEQQLLRMQQEATDSALQEVQRTLEAIQPVQAKEQILMMLDENGGEQGMNDVVAMIRAMPLDKRKKILGEFKTQVEVERLHEILQRLREGEPEISLIRDAQQQLQGG
jgi:hypothetical protein